MRITRVETFKYWVHWRNWLFVRLHTDRYSDRDCHADAATDRHSYPHSRHSDADAASGQRHRLLGLGDYDEHDPGEFADGLEAGRNRCGRRLGRLARTERRLGNRRSLRLDSDNGDH